MKQDDFSYILYSEKSVNENFKVYEKYLFKFKCVKFN